MKFIDCGQQRTPKGWPFGSLVKLLLLTGQRLGEVSGTRWEELDLEAKLWTIPGERVKNGQRHEVPLSDLAIEVLKSQPRIRTSKGFIFTTRGNAAVSGFPVPRNDAAMIAHGETVEHWTMHDLRRTMASGMARLGIQLRVIEKILKHTSGSFRGVGGVYHRHSFADEKRAARDAWAGFVAATIYSWLCGSIFAPVPSSPLDVREVHPAPATLAWSPVQVPSRCAQPGGLCVGHQCD